jgi:Protein of unknown function (DUF2591)
MKTSELQGAALDWAVAKCEDKQGKGLDWAPPAYSTDWAQGGPIIERELIHLTHRRGELLSGENWTAFMDMPHRYAEGATPLIAAMRCYVASKLGEEVEIPEELK